MRRLRRRGVETLFGNVLLAVLLQIASEGFAQQPNQVTGATNSAAPLTITLQDALARARVNEPQYRSAITAYGVAKENTVQSRAALLPNASYPGSYLRTAVANLQTLTGKF